MPAAGPVSALRRKQVEATFEFTDAGFESLVGVRGGLLLKQHVEGGARHFRYAADAAGKAEFAEADMLLFSEAEADHATARFDGHWVPWRRRTPAGDCRPVTVGKHKLMRER